MNIDQQLFIHLNNIVTQFPFLSPLIVFCAEYSQYALGLFLALLLFFPKNERAKNRVMVGVSVVAAGIARWVVKTGILVWYHHPRPYVVLSGVHQLIRTYTYENYQSFPSGHAIFFFALATSLFLFNKRLGLWYFVAAIIMGIARIMAGVHWPSDIVGGAILGIIIGWGTYRLYFINQLTTEKTITKIFSIFKL